MASAVKQRPARRIDLAYIITAWTKEADDEHRVLGAVLASLYRQNHHRSQIFAGCI